jgi:hypothetical protein
MRRWYVVPDKGEVHEAMGQASVYGEYITSGGGGPVFVRAPDELGAWAKATEMLREREATMEFYGREKKDAMPV